MIWPTVIRGSSDAYGHGYFDGFSIVGGHEFAEAETDPYPSSGWADAGGADARVAARPQTP